MTPAEIRGTCSERLQHEWDADPRWTGSERGYEPDEVIRLRGSVDVEHSLARQAPRSSGAGVASFRDAGSAYSPDAMARGLDGDWQVHRTGGFLPPMIGVRKHIEGDRGSTSLGPLPGVPFDVVGNELRYRGPFSGFVDTVEPSSEGYRGRALAFGREIGTFRLVRRAPSR